MIEVLVSLTVVAFGLLGLAGLQARSMSFQKDSFDRKAAAEMAAQITERVRANYDGFRAGNYHQTMQPFHATPLPTDIPACADVQNCTAAEVAARDWAMLRIDVRRRLPVSGVYMTAPAAALQMQLVMAWQEVIEDADVDPACATVGIVDKTFRCFAWVVHP